MLSGEHYQEGRLKEAIAAAIDEVKAEPGDVGRRVFLAELLCFAGDLERADIHLNAVAQLDNKSALATSLMRQLVRAEKSRREFYDAGRVPECVAEPSEELQLRIRASLLLREGNTAEAAKLLEEAEGKRPDLSGTCNGEAFQGLRDLDDLTSSFFEVLTSTGKYFWVPMDHVESLEFDAPQDVRDLLWRPVRMLVHGGPDGHVYMPVLYADSHAHADEQVKLGRKTEWIGDDATVVRGLGQKMFLLGEQDLPVMELKRLVLSTSAGDES